MKLTEAVVAIAIATVLTAVFAGAWLARKPYALRASIDMLASALSDARAVAQTSGSGATLTMSSDAGGVRATIYPYRPIDGVDPAPPVRSVRARDVALAPAAIAVFISSSGTASSAIWTPQSGTLAAEPICNGAIPLTFSDGFRNETHAIACGDATLR